MNLTSPVRVIIALGLTSILVRVLPVLVRIPVGIGTRRDLEVTLPTAVFLNFIAYIVWTEMHSAPIPAASGIAVVLALTVWTRAGLILSTFAGTVAYAFVLHIN